MSGRLVGGQFTLGHSRKQGRQASTTGSSESLQTGELYVKIHPPGAIVRLDGALMALHDRGTVLFTRVSLGRHILEVSKAGYGRVEKVVSVPAGGSAGTVKLTRMLTRAEISLNSGRTVVHELVSREGTLHPYWCRLGA